MNGNLNNNINNINNNISKNNINNINKNNINNINKNNINGSVDKFVNICLSSPNMGLTLFHLVFVIIIPIILIGQGHLNILKLYLLLMVPLAMIFKEMGKPDLFKNLFPVYLYPHNNHPTFVSFLSRLIIILMTVGGVLWNSVSFGIQKNDIEKGVLLGLLNFIIIYCFSLLLIPFTMNKIDDYIEEDAKTYQDISHRYIMGIILFILVFLVIYGVNNLYKTSY